MGMKQRLGIAVGFFWNTGAQRIYFLFFGERDYSDLIQPTKKSLSGELRDFLCWYKTVILSEFF